MVEVTGLEPAASWSQTTRATSCATPRTARVNISHASLIVNIFKIFMEVFMKKIVVATKNSYKVSEIKEMLNLPDIKLFSMTDLGIDIDIIEDGSTFEENAMIKAKKLYDYIGDDSLSVIADDSGLCVDFLDGAPGIYSARYSGGGDAENNLKLLDVLKDVPPNKRTAHFTCALVLVSNNENQTFLGTCSGIIGFEEKGQNKFGYDPLFIYPAADMTFGEMSKEQKNKVSHRANAIELLKDYLKNR